MGPQLLLEYSGTLECKLGGRLGLLRFLLFLCLSHNASVSFLCSGKSSLLNALLDEAAVLPTSGSRGCTAAVVELVYNHDLLGDAKAAKPQGTARTKEVPVYRGEVEFMKKEDCR
jgi:hypothetical protein